MKKQRVFQEGLIYVFSCKKFKKDRFLGKLWDLYKNCNGMKVVNFEVEDDITFKEQWAYLKDGTHVHVDWCKCIGKEQTND